MTTEQATYRYFKVLVPAIIVNVVGSTGLRWASENASISSFALYASALIPAIAMMFVFWAHWRFAHEIDEFMRLIQLKATLFGLGCVMAVATGWGTLELLADAPRLSIFWMMPLFLVSHSVATLFLSKKEGMF